MVAEFINRQSGSPINGETACLNGNMPASHTMGHHSIHDSHGPLSHLSHHHPANSNDMQQQQQQHQQQQHQQQQGHSQMQQQGQGQGHHSHHQHQQQQQGQGQVQQGRQQQQEQQLHESQVIHPENYPPNFDIRKELFSQRKQREFIPDNKKDDSYWDRRRRNNEAAKRSREKRRFNDMVLEQRVMELSKENHILKTQLEAIRDKFGICGEAVISAEHVLAALPNDTQSMSVKRPKLPTSASLLYTRSPSPVHTSVIHQPVSGSGGGGGGGTTGIGARSPRSPAQLYVPETSAYPETESFQYPYTTHQTIHFDTNTTSALNLSRGSRRAQSPFELSSGSGDESTQIVAQHSSLTNNSLPHKLRHKSRIGDKDAASALLALQGIKQEPPGPRASPPWDNEGSSDERDSGISIGAEWTAVPTSNNSVTVVPESEREVKSRLDRLASEVASLQSILRLSKNTDNITPLVAAAAVVVNNHQNSNQNSISSSTGAGPGIP